jgi:inosine-uridine nucleoside N-ribohydrolase
VGETLVMKIIYTCACFALLAYGWVPPVVAQPGDPIDVWLDVDPANGVGEVDDGLMMIQVFHSPDLKPHGVSVVFGNTELTKALPIAHDIVTRFGPPGLTVARGAASKAEFGQETDATLAMADALRRHPLTILAVGPVTNVGTLVKRHPELHDRIQRIVMVAGRREYQRFSVSAPTLSDFNFEHDPAAMQAILDSEILLMFAPWEVSSKVWINRSDLKALAATGAPGAWIADSCADWIARWEKRIGPWGFNPFDSLAAGWLTHPDLIESIRVDARIEMGPDDGAKLVGRDAAAPKPYLVVKPASRSDREILYAHQPDSRFKGVLLRRLAGNANTVVPHAQGLAKSAPEFDHSAFHALLRRHVVDGLVDYGALQSKSQELDAYIATLGAANLGHLGRDEHLALLINAYNAFTLRLILDHYPVKSIKDIPEAKRWKDKRWDVAGQTWSLDQIEHEQIRPKFREPRIHFALVCAAVGCPPLRAEAYTGAKLEAQLADQSHYLHTHVRWFQFDEGGNVVHMTKLYDWYRDDFKQAARSVLAFAGRYSIALQQALKSGNEPKIEWREYNWHLNDRTNRP